jgi:low affinity Fe/Cu permease
MHLAPQFSNPAATLSSAAALAQYRVLDSAAFLAQGGGAWSSHPIRRGLTGLGVLAAHPAAFGIVAVYAVLWFFLQRDTFDWHAVALLAPWCMTLVIQRAVHRDNQALQAKLDELLRVHGGASNELTKLDQQEPEDIERHRDEAQKKD